MGRRITIVLDEELDKKLRLLQGKLIQKTRENVSFSKVINDVLGTGLKNGKVKNESNRC